MMKLLYIDEQSNQRDTVFRAAVFSECFAEDEVETLAPCSTVDETIAVVLESGCSVLISDYRLNEEDAAVTFNGLDLIAEVQARLVGFPCFLTTNYVGEAIGKNVSVDVNAIFPKSDYLAEQDEDHKSELPFFLRVRAKTEEYISIMKKKEERLLSLLAKAEESELAAADLQELIDLDDYLEASTVGRNKIPSIVKGEHLQVFNTLIQRANELCEEVEDQLAKGHDLGFDSNSGPKI
ncbi:hypothetical protein [Thalassospira lucentensis]|uniref:hypothetical protein n=1 Tax=Thalassospira lucentensis TaxID=168935 RepID=UPI00399D596F